MTKFKKEHGFQDQMFFVMQTLIEIDSAQPWIQKCYELFHSNAFYLGKLDPDLSLIEAYVKQNPCLKLLLNDTK